MYFVVISVLFFFFKLQSVLSFEISNVILLRITYQTFQDISAQLKLLHSYTNYYMRKFN